MLRWYQARLAARPLLTQSVTTFILFGVGDVTAQQLVERRGVEKHDLVRTGRMALYGGAVFGPAATTWYKILSKHVNFKSANATTAARVAADQLVFAPIFIGVFLGSMAALEGGSPRAKLETSYRDALTSNWMVWPLAQAVNFKLVPLEHRVLFVNIVSIGWNSYLSYLNSRGASSPAVGAAAAVEEKVKAKVA